jgi:hypothetical protein
MLDPMIVAHLESPVNLAQTIAHILQEIPINSRKVRLFLVIIRKATNHPNNVPTTAGDLPLLVDEGERVVASQQAQVQVARSPTEERVARNHTEVVEAEWNIEGVIAVVVA